MPVPVAASRNAVRAESETNWVRQVAGTDMPLAGDAVHLRSLGDGLFRTRHIIHRAVAAYEQSKRLLAQIELAERKLRRS